LLEVILEHRAPALDVEHRRILAAPAAIFELEQLQAQAHGAQG